ncbi:MAG: DUF4366 domain-containing protein [Oscillospiraceae bacterium]|nr:DUF4366 domain-containing protein [Oscillospiraceae bacterium]
MNKKKSHFFITLLAVMLCMTAFSSVAYAGGGPETEEPISTPTPTPSETPVIEDGTPLDEDGNLITRDLLYDKNTNKQFIAVETRNGKVFYIVIDYDKPVDEDLEQYHAYFLNMVDERDLLDIVDADDLTGETSSVSTLEPSPSPEPSSDSADEKEPASQNNTGGIVAVVLIVAVIGGAAVYFLKFRKPKQSVKGKSDLDEYDFGEDEDAPENDTEPEVGPETEDEDQ